VETPLPDLPGTYDFSFSKVNLKEEELLLWCIYDYTDLYEDLRQFQQRKNELEIHRETLERRHKALDTKEDITMQQNIIIESLDHLQLTYFNKIKSALLAPVNALDGITFLLTQALENKNKKYTQQLRGAIRQLDLILDDLENVNVHKVPDFTQQDFSLLSLCIEAADLVKQNNPSTELSFSIEENIPKSIKGNYLYLKQVLFGILGNAIKLHPDSNFEIKISTLNQHKDQIHLSFQVIEFLSQKTRLLSKEDYTIMIYRLSIIKQLLDLQKGNLQVNKDQKNLSITINFDLEYSL